MLQIDKLDVYRLRRPLITPWRTAYGVEPNVETLFVRSTSHSGQEAWIESCPLGTPLYLPETAGSAFRAVVDNMAPWVIGQPFANPTEPYDRLAPFKGNSFAKAAIDLSFWAQWCLHQEKPLHRVLHGTTKPIPTGRGFSLSQSPDDLIRAIERAVTNGCQRAKLKISPDTSITSLKAVREHFPELPMHVDCNGSFDQTNKAYLLELDTLGFNLVEQPFDYKDLRAHAELQAEISTPVCLDESVCDVDDAHRALALNACRAMALKPGRVGGITPFKRILEMCAGKVTCYVGGMLESGLGTAMNIELATLDGLDYVPDIPASGQYFEDELVTPFIVPEHGFVLPSTTPWLGREVQEDRLGAYVIEQATLA